MSRRDDPVTPLPTFAPLTPDPAETTAPAPGGPAPEPTSPKPARPAAAGTRTPTSSGSADGLAKTIAGIVGLVLRVMGALARRGARIDLRQPTRHQLDEFGAPTARIIARHYDIANLSPDLADGLAAATAAADYLIADEPLLTRARPRVEQLVGPVDELDVAPAAPGAPEPYQPPPGFNGWLNRTPQQPAPAPADAATVTYME